MYTLHSLSLNRYNASPKMLSDCHCVFIHSKKRDSQEFCLFFLIFYIFILKKKIAQNYSKLFNGSLTVFCRWLWESHISYMKRTLNYDWFCRCNDFGSQTFPWALDSFLLWNSADPNCYIGHFVAIQMYWHF